MARGWKTDFRFKRVQAEIHKRATIAGRHLGQEMVYELTEDVSTPAPPHSRPGEPAHTFSGEMIASMVWDVSASSNAIIVSVGNTSDHAVYTEFGQAGGANYDARPWFRIGLISRVDTVAQAWVTAFA